jgi:hypothetical protein
MNRPLLLVIALVTGLATAVSVATAIAGGGSEPVRHNFTVIEKNQAYPVLGPLRVTRCRVEDCSDA